MIIVNTSNEELLKSVKDDMDRLQKEAEDALDENKDEAEDIAEDHGEDTKTVKEVVTDKTDRKQLKSMHLSESLFEDLEEDDYFDFEQDVYDAIKRECLKSYNRYLSLNQIKTAVLSFLDRIEDDEEFTAFFDNAAEDSADIPGFEDTQDMLDKLTIYGESLTEELSSNGKKIVAELKQELGPELQKKVVALMKDLQSSITKTANKAVDTAKDEKQTNESLNESMWSVYYVDDDPQEGTLFAEEEDARKFQAEMGDEWEVAQLPNTPWDDLADTDLL